MQKFPYEFLIECCLLQMWRWTAEKARLGAALKLAEAGLSKRGGRRVS